MVHAKDCTAFNIIPWPDTTLEVCCFNNLFFFSFFLIFADDASSGRESLAPESPNSESEDPTGMLWGRQRCIKFEHLGQGY